MKRDMFSVVAMMFLLLSQAVSAHDFGEYAAHIQMPEIPDDPAMYESMWDPFVIRRGVEGTPIEVNTEKLRNATKALTTVTTNDNQLEVRVDYKNELRVLSGFDALPWNGRQVVRDVSGNWLVLVEQQDGTICLATAAKSLENPYRPRGGDLAGFILVGTSPEALIKSGEKVSCASMAFDGQQHLHVVWHSDSGLWHVKTRSALGSLAQLQESQSWAAPRRVVEGRCRHGDIMRDNAGGIALCYAQGDVVYFRKLSDNVSEEVASVARGLPALPEDRGGKIRTEQRECQDVAMDMAPDGTVWLVFRREFCVWVAQRAPEGFWRNPERVAREYVFHPSIMVAGNQPLVVFLHEGLRRIPLDLDGVVGRRAGGGARVGYAMRAERGWQVRKLVAAEEIPVFRRGMWAFRGRGQLYSQIEQLGWPVLCRDPKGVVWALWQNTTRRWVYCARWMGDSFGEVQECRGPFNAPCLPVNAEKHAPSDADDMGALFFAAAGGGYNRAIFDRLRIPSLSTTEDREILFLDSLEVARTRGVEFRLNQMEKPSQKPALAAPDARGVWSPWVSRRGDCYTMSFSYPVQKGNLDGKKSRGVAVSKDGGVHFEIVDKLPPDMPNVEDYPTRPLCYWRGQPENSPPAYFENPDITDPEKKFMRMRLAINKGGESGDYTLEFSGDGKQWGQAFVVTASESMRERATPNFFNREDPERPIRIYSRVYTETGRSWGVIWSHDLQKWSGMEHLLDPDQPYHKVPAENKIRGGKDKRYGMRGQVYLDSVAGKGEDEIYASSVSVAEGLYFAFYWPGAMGCPLKDVGIAVSRDGFNFTRVKNGERVLAVGEPGTWDSGYIFQMYPMVDNDMVRVYYRGTAGCREGSDSFGHNLTEIGLALIRINGWTYYTPRVGVDQAMVTTIPIHSTTGSKRGLRVNVEGISGNNAPFAVEVVDARTDKAIGGYRFEDCLPIANGVASPVTWQGGRFLPTGYDIRLNFRLGAASLRFYSFGFTGDTE